MKGVQTKATGVGGTSENNHNFVWYQTNELLHMSRIPQGIVCAIDVELFDSGGAVAPPSPVIYPRTKGRLGYTFAIVVTLLTGAVRVFALTSW